MAELTTVPETIKEGAFLSEKNIYYSHLCYKSYKQCYITYLEFKAPSPADL